MIGSDCFLEMFTFCCEDVGSGWGRSGQGNHVERLLPLSIQAFRKPGSSNRGGEEHKVWRGY